MALRAAIYLHCEPHLVWESIWERILYPLLRHLSVKQCQNLSAEREKCSLTRPVLSIALLLVSQDKKINLLNRADERNERSIREQSLSADKFSQRLTEGSLRSWYINCLWNVALVVLQCTCSFLASLLHINKINFILNVPQHQLYMVATWLDRLILSFRKLDR